MNNKGFTLLEVMGVLLLLVIILLVTVPNITNTIKKSNLDSLEKYEETLCLGAESYIIEEDIDLSISMEIKASTLISNNYVADNLTNPDTKKSALRETLVVSRGSDNQFKCNIKD